MGGAAAEGVVQNAARNRIYRQPFVAQNARGALPQTAVANSGTPVQPQNIPQARTNSRPTQQLNVIVAENSPKPNENQNNNAKQKSLVADPGAPSAAA